MTADLTGATYVDAGQLPVIVGAGVLPVTFTVEGVDYEAWCVSNLVINFRNNGRAIACLGQEAANEVVLGRFECEITADIYLAHDTDVLMDAFLDRTEIMFNVVVADSLGNQYEFHFPRVRVSACTEVAGGTNQDVIMSITTAGAGGHGDHRGRAAGILRADHPHPCHHAMARPGWSSDTRHAAQRPDDKPAAGTIRTEAALASSPITVDVEG